MRGLSCVLSFYNIDVIYVIIKIFYYILEYVIVEYLFGTHQSFSNLSINRI